MDVKLYNTDCQVITTEEGEKLKKAFNQMHREREGFYQFTVTDVGQIDLNRIVREQHEAGHLVTLLTDGKNPKAVLVHTDFLNRFSENDNLYFNGERLSPSWGKTYHQVFHRNREFAVSILIEESKLEEGRLLPFYAGPIGSPRTVETLKTELAAARAFRRKITVKVHTL